MRSHFTREFMAACAVMQRFGRPGTPTTNTSAAATHFRQARRDGLLAARRARVNYRRIEDAPL
jgi:hypothetical protein